MITEFVPVAVGQSDGVIVLWEGVPEIGVAFPRTVQVIEEVQCGIGMINGEQCLILYLFAGDSYLQVYLKQFLPTSPDEVIDGWELLCAWNPNMLKVRYGDSPRNKDKEVTFLLPAGEGEQLIDQLKGLITRIGNENERANETWHHQVISLLESHISAYANGGDIG